MEQKRFDTAVGEKVAIVWFSRTADEAGNPSITGEYGSDGSNILSLKVELLNENATMVRVAETVKVFVDNCEKATSESYAVRLLRQ